jgi:TonB family protein
MLRYIIISFAGHIVVIGILFYLANLQQKPDFKVTNIYSVKAVSAASLSKLMEKTNNLSEPKPNIPQIKTETKVLPKKDVRKKSQTVKGSSKTDATKVTKSKSKENGSGVAGMQTDSVFPFPEYLLKIRDLIQEKWNPPAGGNYKTIVYFKIGRNGKILRVQVERQTNNMAFDKSAWDAVQGNDPFPPLPEGYKNESLGVHFEFINED